MANSGKSPSSRGPVFVGGCSTTASSTTRLGSDTTPTTAPPSTAKEQSTPIMSVTGGRSSKSLLAMASLRQGASKVTRWFNAEDERSCSWGYTASLMMAEFVGLALLSFPSIFAQLGVANALLCITFVMACYVYTSLQIGKFCQENDGVRDVVDIAVIVCGRHGAKARVVTAIFFLLNNTFVMAVHVQTGGQFWDQMNSGFICVSVTGCLLTAALCLSLSCPRTLKLVAVYSFASVVTTIAGCVYQMVQTPHYSGAKVSAGPAADMTLRSGMVSFLSIAFAFVGQITLPSFIAQMKNPKDFSKALYTSAAVEWIIFCTFGLYMYSRIGADRMESPVIYAIPEEHRQAAWSLMQPTILCLGAIYACVNARFMFTRLVKTGSVHYKNTFKGWAIWIGLLFGCWSLAFIISQTIPQFESLLALIGAVFDALFGYIYWGILWFFMQSQVLQPLGENRKATLKKIFRHQPIQATINAGLVVVGVVIFLMLGGWASFSHIVASFQDGKIRAPFSCYYGSEGCS